MRIKIIIKDGEEFRSNSMTEREADMIMERYGKDMDNKNDWILVNNFNKVKKIDIMRIEKVSE